MYVRHEPLLHGRITAHLPPAQRPSLQKEYSRSCPMIGETAFSGDCGATPKFQAGSKCAVVFPYLLEYISANTWGPRGGHDSPQEELCLIDFSSGIFSVTGFTMPAVKTEHGPEHQSKESLLCFVTEAKA